MLVAAVVLIVVAVGVGIAFALAKVNPKEFEREIALAELEGHPQTDPQPSSGGAHSPLPSEPGRASPNQLDHPDLPRLG